MAYFQGRLEIQGLSVAEFARNECYSGVLVPMSIPSLYAAISVCIQSTSAPSINILPAHPISYIATFPTPVATQNHYHDHCSQ
jgi:hypothetical protein